MAPRARTVWRCQQCGAQAPRWIGRCPDCGEFGTYSEELDPADAPPRAGSSPPREAVMLADAGDGGADERTPAGIAEFDRVLGGGLVTGSLVLLGGEPGIGKSTLLLQVSDAVARSGRDVLYVCGEESPDQIGMRARRLRLGPSPVTLLPEIDMASVEAYVRAHAPGLLIVDSIQTAFDPDLAGAPGSVGQVRTCTARLMRIAKELGVTTIIVGHVTKEGAIAGPRVLEHMVDAVLYFEGDRDHAFRIVRAVKNRFGPISEIGIFEMGEGGLTGVANPSALLLGERSDASPGSVVMATMEGSRPLLVEVQALVTPTYLQIPRRLAMGIESARLVQVIAVLERRAGQDFSGRDVYVSVAGGVRVNEPAIDLPLALALVSARKDRPAPAGLCAFGEIGLTGHVRPVPHSEARMREAARQGLSEIVANLGVGAARAQGLRLHEVSDVAAALRLIDH